MRTIFFILIIFVSSFAAIAQETNYVQDAMRYLELNGTTKQYNQAVDQLFVMLKKQYSGVHIPDSVWTELEEVKPQELMKIKSLLVAAYRSNFSQEEIKKMIEFYSSPAGKQLATDPTAMTEEQKKAFVLFGQSEIGQKIEHKKQPLSQMVGEVSELWSRELYKNITGQLKAKGYSL